MNAILSKPPRPAVIPERESPPVGHSAEFAELVRAANAPPPEPKPIAKPATRPAYQFD